MSAVSLLLAALNLAAAAPPAGIQGVPEAPRVDVAAADDSATMASPTDNPRSADALGLQLSERLGVWSHDRDLDGKTGVAAAGVWGQLTPRLGGLIGRAEGYVETDRVRGVHSDLTEGWFGAAEGPFEVRLGRQIIVWGRADRLNPTDNLSGRDYTLLLATDDEQRQGPGMAQLRWGQGVWTVDAFWLPEFRKVRLPVDRPGPGVSLIPDASRNRADQFAFKIDNSGGGIDWSISWFHGIDRNRDVHAVAPPVGFIAGVQQQYPDIDVYGADAAGVVGPVGWRIEMAYSHIFRTNDDPFTQHSNLWVVAGGDVGLGDGWNLNLQYSYRQIFSYSDPRRLPDPVTRAIASLSAAVNNQLDPVQHGITARLARAFFNDTLQTELAAIHYFETNDTALRPKLNYAITDDLRLAVGADIFMGPSLSYFGRVRSLSSGWVQLSRGF